MSAGPSACCLICEIVILLRCDKICILYLMGTLRGCSRIGCWRKTHVEEQHDLYRYNGE